ncbi:uncharacterized protein FIESC28_11067 [Fusarium coffeatum]|uniref:Uncharacterized protein n=1 Tax=Fusarium coffeatum TaxID=231269 RepID=A0A366QNE2_9HYPO|nr:uncharacterized protein FIESC28_11067 [Fusarium coffeatum]RBR06444.1 hypothetical protein FIESC28_11067 [Fusarium coffeatum]
MSFDKLPPEILLEIGRCVNQDLRKLSSTCRRFMAVFQNKVYSTLDFDETSKSADRALAVAIGPRKQLVRTIRFIPHNPRPHEDETPDQGIKLSDKARQVLGSLHKFPSLYKFQFDLSTWCIDQCGVPSHERFQSVYSGEPESVPWRHLIDQSLRALNQNLQNRGAFSRLEMKGFPPIGLLSSLLNFAWHDLLKSIETFEISLAVTQNEQDIRSMTHYELFYWDFDLAVL